MADSKAQYGFLGDYEFLNRDFPIASGTRHTWLLDDILLTVFIFLGACYDLTSGIFNFAMTDWAIATIQGFNETMDDRFVTLTRVRGVSGIEGGLAGLLVGVYRIARWGRKQRFNGINFQVWTTSVPHRSFSLTHACCPLHRSSSSSRPSDGPCNSTCSCPCGTPRTRPDSTC